MTTENEIWLPIPGYPDYEVSNQGRVRSYKSGNPRIMRQIFTSKGYKLVCVGKANQRVHRLVLTAFVCPCPEGHQARHLNGVRDDNRLENLKWGTAKENAADMYLHGTTNAGTRHWSNKLTEAQVIHIKKSLPINQAAIAKEYNVSPNTISSIVCGRTWKHITI